MLLFQVVAYRASQFGSAPEIQKLQVGDVFGDTSRIRDMIQALHGASISPSTPQTASPRRHGCLRYSLLFRISLYCRNNFLTIGCLIFFPSILLAIAHFALVRGRGQCIGGIIVSNRHIFIFKISRYCVLLHSVDPVYNGSIVFNNFDLRCPTTAGL